MRDPFEIDNARRNAIAERIYAVRAKCADAVEHQDPNAALAALQSMYELLDTVPDAQLLYVPGADSGSFVLPEIAKQMTAKWPGFCAVCEGRIGRGDMMYWVPSTRESICAACSIQEFHGK